MTFAYNEVVRSGNSSARVKNFYANNLIVLIDINGEFKAGDTITGDDSGYSYTLNSFGLGKDYDSGFVTEIWDELEPVAITLDDGRWVVQDAHFSGKPSQDYQPDNVIIVET